MKTNLDHFNHKRGATQIIQGAISIFFICKLNNLSFQVSLQKNG